MMNYFGDYDHDECGHYFLHENGSGHDDVRDHDHDRDDGDHDHDHDYISVRHEVCIYSRLHP